ncbi:hypothetical protein [Candidatus Hepatobacter penaei]|uniref:hypothetical protein n=1 Tax=Candidatus Hepatobacter penaei TaxID=1274402 RepID=UPI0004F242F7|nr:hypothetical protein [Candidatus Hepatobacter penaei]TGW14908.1 hypothetical protein EIL50_03135 [bacterium NHP-B]
MIALLCLFFPMTLEAYLDPGSGGALLQILFGGIVGTLAVVKIYWHSLKSFFCRLVGKKPKV